ncbi:hypothetical protein ACH5RR_013105 [Cinchona calisaya]|uniref:Uncharacterized protein n=1 Tax=Cinchona calisaya TaxID=153742 RepID=A0ABD3A4U1_9GENT
MRSCITPRFPATAHGTATSAPQITTAALLTSRFAVAQNLSTAIQGVVAATAYMRAAAPCSAVEIFSTLVKMACLPFSATLFVAKDEDVAHLRNTTAVQDNFHSGHFRNYRKLGSGVRFQGSVVTPQHFSVYYHSQCKSSSYLLPPLVT